MFFPAIANDFLPVDDFRLSSFVEEIAERKKVLAFYRRLKEASKSPHLMQSIQDRQYVEVIIAGMLGMKIKQKMFDFPKRELFSDSLFEASEFLSVLRSVYAQIPQKYKKPLKGAFNSGFDNPMGMLPLVHEMSVARHLSQSGLEVEFSDYAGDRDFDFAVSRDGFEVQVDCKVCGGDNGKVFKISTVDSIFGDFKRIVKKSRSDFSNKIICISAHDSAERKKLRDSASFLFSKLIEGETSAYKSGVSIDLYEFEEDALDRYLAMGVDSIQSVVKEIINKSNPEWDETVEWEFSPRKYLMREFPTSILFCSKKPPRIFESAKRVIKDSLRGQLRGCPNPVIFLRYNEFSRNELEAVFETKTDVNTGVVNPIDSFFADLLSDEVGKRICGLVVMHRPSFRETSILGLNGKRQTQGNYPILSRFNRAHPRTKEVQKLLGF